MTKLKTIKKSRHQGFTLFIAVLLTSILLSIALSLANFTVKQSIISSFGRESQFSFYAADSGIECAFYYDLKDTNVFATSSDSTVYNLRAPAGSLKFCNGVDITTVRSEVISTTAATTTFGYTFLPQTYCVSVIVGKSGNQTTVEARGYNRGSGPTCTVSGADNRRVERAVRVRY